MSFSKHDVGQPSDLETFLLEENIIVVRITVGNYILRGNEYFEDGPKKMNIMNMWKEKKILTWSTFSATIL